MLVLDLSNSTFPSPISPIASMYTQSPHAIAGSAKLSTDSPGPHEAVTLRASVAANLALDVG